MVIYKITNTLNGKMYIGQTRMGTGMRWNCHVCDAFRKGRQKALPLYRAFRKYGTSNFTIEVLELCVSLEHLNTREVFWIKELDSRRNGYNLTDGGKAYECTPETREKMAAAKRGKKRGPMSEETKRKIGKANLNSQVFTPERRAFLSRITKVRMLKNNPFKGRRHTAESKAKMSLALTGRKYHSEAFKGMMSERMMGDRNPFYGKQHTQETMDRIKRNMRHPILTPELSEKLSAAAYRSWETRRRKACLQ